MEAFYLPIKYLYKSSSYNFQIPIIVYIAKEDNNIKAVLNTSIENHIETLYKQIESTSDRTLVMQGDYHIVFLRDVKGQLITSVWAHCNVLTNNNNSGPRVVCFTYQRFTKIDPYNLDIYFGFGFGDDLVVLGAEEALRRRYYPDLNKYLDRNVNNLPYFPPYMRLYTEYK